VEPLPPDQIRVLGVLVEKQRTVPDSYPLTLNSLRTGCNQSSNRDPVTAYGEGYVQTALDLLREAKLIRIVYSPSNRAPKYRHVLDEVWELDPSELAVLTPLLLRGPNTVPELRSRTERYEPRVASVEDALESLAAKGFVTNIGRASGQREDRWMHLVGGPAGPSGRWSGDHAADDIRGAAPSKMVAPTSADRMAALEARVARLEEALGMSDAGPPPADRDPQGPLDDLDD
jgi:uncharacterized protein YceH (UPF0502 family)